MKTKIQIKSIFGKVLFEYEKKDNNLKETLVEAASRGADLTGADLRGAYLTGAYLTGADLRGAYLRGADLRGAYLTGAYLTGADLTGAYLTGADLRGAEYKGVKIKKAAVFTGLYKYLVMSILDENNEKYIKMGCFFRKLKDWENDFWNNDNEFPNDNSEKSKLRLFAYKTAKKWFKTIEEKK